MSRRTMFLRRPDRAPWRRAAAALAVIMGALFFSSAAAAPYVDRAPPAASQPSAIGGFSVNGAPVTLIAYGKRAAIIDAETAARLKESEQMGRAMPGYPQEAQINLGLRVPF